MSPHCWHYTNGVTMGMGPTRSEYRCCWCNDYAFRLAHTRHDPEHGPYEHSTVLVDYEVSPNWDEPCARRIAEGA